MKKLNFYGILFLSVWGGGIKQSAITKHIFILVQQKCWNRRKDKNTLSAMCTRTLAGNLRLWSVIPNMSRS
ncbi:MAG: hypothetical protein K2G88_06930, partial [Oscillospiraceae bacterium]|nr:hypothetical protein [Oscillospiraceae bacterium]